MMLFPKQKMKKKRKKHGKSILQRKEDRRCYLCMLLNADYGKKRYLEEHHVLFGNDRNFAEEEGLKVNLCYDHHRGGRYAVHNNDEVADILKRIAQEEWEKEHSRDEWMQRVGKNYL